MHNVDHCHATCHAARSYIETLAVRGFQLGMTFCGDVSRVWGVYKRMVHVCSRKDFSCLPINRFCKIAKKSLEDPEDVHCPKSCSRPAGCSSHRSDYCIERNDASLKFYSASVCCKAHLSPSDSLGVSLLTYLSTQQTCLPPALAASGCDMSNTTCLCTSQVFNCNVGQCEIDTCTPDEFEGQSLS